MLYIPSLEFVNNFMSISPLLFQLRDALENYYRQRELLAEDHAKNVQNIYFDWLKSQKN